MRMYDLILKKRRGSALSTGEIAYLIGGVTDGSIPDPQISAFLMAVCFQGMTPEETVEFTLAMARSGEMADLSAIKAVKVDKHSTGGVGDKTTLAVAPIVAACGAAVAKMSGKGLGHTGGTVDKLASIPGFKTELLREDFIRIVNETGLCVVGQSGALAPADKKLYALRDVTGTVDSLPLIASSIMSKKLAAGADCILLDVKTGSGAFMKTAEESVELAKAMVAIGEGAGKKTAALITDMDRPLGFAVGNALEVMEAAETLKGNGPGDFYELCITLSAHMLLQAGKGTSYGECRNLAENAVASGAAFHKLCDMVTAQGGDASSLSDYAKLPRAAGVRQVPAPASGYVQAMDTAGWGTASVVLGAGRAKAGDAIDYGAGIMLRKKPGDYVNAGETVAELYTNDEKAFPDAERIALRALTVGAGKPAEKPLIYAKVDADGVEYF
ncbi:MAG: thymidine phosphorylase [Clostridiales bacterium]|jgi:pyrimidine-nucleoside phosphorylase|nr:thymidine phosphorylase [Clostridiales bacterium]